jgi:hypothetical protein
VDECFEDESTKRMIQFPQNRNAQVTMIRKYSYLELLMGFETT